jgi:hypothetical protein
MLDRGQEGGLSLGRREDLGGLSGFQSGAPGVRRTLGRRLPNRIAGLPGRTRAPRAEADAVFGETSR